MPLLSFPAQPSLVGQDRASSLAKEEPSPWRRLLGDMLLPASDLLQKSPAQGLGCLTLSLCRQWDLGS